MKKHGLSRCVEARLDSNRKAMLLEVKLISLHRTYIGDDRRGTNLTLGGEGTFGHRYTDEQIERRSGPGNPMFGRRYSHRKETIERISATKRRRHPTRKAVRQLTLDGESVCEFPSSHAVEDALGFNHASVSKCLRGEQGRAYGFKWEPIDDPVKEFIDKKKRSVEQLDIAGNVVRRFTSLKDAERATGVLSSSICQCCRGKIRTAGSWMWRYV